MPENAFVKNCESSYKVQPASSELEMARELLKRDRTRGMAALNALFREANLPESPLNGRYRGELLALHVMSGLTQLFDWLAGMWMPWLGKTFDAVQQSGDNIFTRDSYPLARFFNPRYRGFASEGADTYRGFNFRTYHAPGLADPDRMVLKIDYDLDENPALTIRRVLDELVQVSHDVYLGKAHVQWWWGRWQTVAHFLLTRESNDAADG